MYKILFFNFNPAASLHLHSGFREAGCEVYHSSSQPGDTDGEILEDRLLAMINLYKPAIIFSYGYWINTVNMEHFCQVVKNAGLFHIHWAIDDPDCFRTLSLPVAKKADLVFTTAREWIEKYQAEGINAHLLQFGCYPPLLRKVPPEDRFRHDIVLLAHNYNLQWNPSYFAYRLNGIRNILQPIVAHGDDIMVWGLWWQDADRIYNLPGENYGGVLPPGNEAGVYSAAKIVLGLQTVGNSLSTLSARTYEVLCCGAFHLSQYSPALESHFQKGIHLEWSTSPLETLELVEFYLRHDAVRQKIAAQGQKEVLKKHTYMHRALSALKVIKKII
ncbi:CgeB family protein [Candidatus Formimonas warabiya]|uniref:Glycosyltransferase n=1 Tax=Formimonas warabiya TaxID=1761012 RepID=A0A3G1KSI6_FORW1|nr:glycosyltransferase [Candidatus Formimonas warabiya]ATW25390.1 hypothetical protein DCMF_11960 [Candidatus Formimonas warabiya]